MVTSFNSVVVAADPATGQDRALVIAERLGKWGRLPVEVLTIAPREGHDVAAGVIEAVGKREGALLVMATGAAALVSDTRRSVTASVLEALRQPVLVIGPEVRSSGTGQPPTLVVGVPVESQPSPTAAVVEAWQRTFRGGQPWLVDVVAAGAWPPGSIEPDWELERVRAAAAEFDARGIETTTSVLHTGDPVDALLELAADVSAPIYVVTSDRWSGGPSHWYSTARRLVRRSPQPVLVVPSDLAVA